MPPGHPRNLVALLLLRSAFIDQLRIRLGIVMRQRTFSSGRRGEAFAKSSAAWVKSSVVLGCLRIPRMLDMLTALDGVGTFLTGFGVGDVTVTATAAVAGGVVGLDSLRQERSVSIGSVRTEDEGEETVLTYPS